MTASRINEIRAIFAKGKRSEVIKAGEDLIAALCKREKSRNPLLKLEMPLALHKIDGFEVAWNDFAADRKERRSPLTSRGAKMILNRLSERPQRAVEVLRKCIEKRWVSFEWEWLDRNGANGKHRPGNGTEPKGWQEFLSADESRMYRGDYGHAPEYLRIEFGRWRKAAAK